MKLTCVRKQIGAFTRALFILLALAATLRADLPASADYQISAAAFDSGGLRAVSADYTNDGSIGLISGLAGDSASGDTIKSGYVAQLYEVKELLLNAPGNPASVIGGKTVQLSAREKLDDASFLAIPPDSVTWSLLNGPITGISAEGQATAEPVSLNALASIQGAVDGFTQSLNINVRVVTADLADALAESTLTTAPQPPEPPGSLRIVLKSASGAVYGGRVKGSVPGWRFVGETQWRSSSDPDSADTKEVVSGLTPGSFPVEFESIVNFTGSPPFFLPAPQPALALVTAGPISVRTFSYPAQTPGQTGQVQIHFFPEEVVSGQSQELTAQWRFLGETGNWRSSGTTVAGLPPGSYLLEFKPVQGFYVLPTLSVPVQAGQTAARDVTYLASESTVGTLPVPLSAQAVANQRPYEFVGQIKTDNGREGSASGSGVVVTARVVLTAAHVVFDDRTLSNATGLVWQFARHAGLSEPEALHPPPAPRGVLILDGYAAQRGQALPGSGTPASWQNDTAVVYFLKDAGNGGASGYLVSDEATNWLAAAEGRRKVLIGYAVDTGQARGAVVPGQMQATPPEAVNFTLLNNGYPQVYQSTRITGLAGMSGGPLCVEFDDGSFYPAGVYLGGTQQCVVRQIDADVQTIIKQADIASEAGENHTSGGSTMVGSPTTADSLEFGALTVQFEPNFPQARWGLTSERGTPHAGGETIQGLAPDSQITVKYASLGAGYGTPPNYGPFSVKKNEKVTLIATYTHIEPPEISSRSLPKAGLDLNYSVTIKATNGPTKFTGTLTDLSNNRYALNVGSNSLGSRFSAGNPPLGLTLNNQGILRGKIPADAAVGTYKLSLTAQNTAGSSAPVSLRLVVTKPNTVTVHYDDTKGTVFMGKTKLVKGQPMPLLADRVALIAVPKSQESDLLGWTGTGTPSVPTTTPALQFNLTQDVNLTAVFDTNPFFAVRGTYHGLLTGASDILDARGFLTVSITPLKAYTAAFYVGKHHYSVRGSKSLVFVLNGQHASSPHARLKGDKEGDFDASLSLDLDLSAKLLTGIVAVNGQNLQLTAYRASFDAKSNPSPQAGKFTIGFPHPTGPGLPLGDGYGAVTIKPNGAVLLVGRLGDGSKISANTLLGPGGQWPFYATGNKGGEVATGWLTVGVPPASAITGKLDWIKAPDDSPYYPQGFTIAGSNTPPIAPRSADAINVLGGILPVTPLQGLSPLSLMVSGGGLVPAVGPFNVQLDDRGKGQSTNPGFTFQFNPATGIFTGKFLGDSKKRPFSGALLPAILPAHPNPFGLGNFLGNVPETGTVEF